MAKKNIKKIILLGFLWACLHPMVLLAQDSDPVVPMSQEYDPDPVPIDGGVGILLAAGVTYGLKKIHDNKRKNKKI